jgi:hypothetical protein
MNPPFFNPDPAAQVDLETADGRSRRFDERIKELMQPLVAGNRGRTFDEALHEMRAGGNPEDEKLLELMGEKSSHFRTAALKWEKGLRNIDRAAEENLRPHEVAPEVQAAADRAGSKTGGQRVPQAFRNSSLRQNSIAFNARLDELMRPDANGTHRTLDEAITYMRVHDRELMAAMGGA